MGTKVQIENYLPAHYSMKDLNRESNGASWTSCFGENNLSNGNGQFYYGFLPRTVADSQPGQDRDALKQTMLEHEAVFKNQVYELHRLYRVQRDLMDEARRKEQFKRRIPHETSSSSSPIPPQMQYEDVQKWNGQNHHLSNSICGRPLIPDAVQSSPYSAKGKSIQAGPSSFPNCYSPKNSESESRPAKHRRRMLDLQLPADEYIDTDEVEQLNDAKDSDIMSSTPEKNKNIAVGNGKLFPAYSGKTECQADASRSDLHVNKPRALADLNEPLNVEEATSVSSVDFLRRSANHCDAQYRDLSTRFLSSSKDFPQNPKNGNMNRTLNNVPFENRANGPDWLCHALESENKDSVRSINQGMCPEKVPVPSQPVHILHDQASQSPAFLNGDHVKGSPWKAKSGNNFEKLDRSYTLSSYNVPGSVASHLPNQPGFFHPSDLGKSLDQSGSSWGKPANFLGQKPQNPASVQTSAYLTSANLSKSPQSSAQSNDLFGNIKWNLNCSPSPLGTEIPRRNGFCDSSLYAFKGVDYVNSNHSDKKVSCSNINHSKATSRTDVNPMRDMNLNVALPNNMPDDHFSQQQGVSIVDKDYKSVDRPVLPWLREKGVCSNDADNSRKGLTSLETLSRWGFSVASNLCEGDVKAKLPNSSSKLLGVSIFENPPTPKKEISNPLIIHNCSGNKKSESSGRRGDFDINLPCDSTEEEVVIVEEKVQAGSASFRHHFDLNSCITEEEVVCETSLTENKTSIRFDTDIDLEAPIILEDEEVLQDDDFSIKEPELPQTNNIAADGEAELAKSAAAAIVAISSFVNLKQSEVSICVEAETDLDDPLHWFVDIACSNGSDLENGDGLPEGLDEFELMTLKQKECTVEEYFPESSFPEVPNVEEKGTCLLTTTRTRKGHGRRGRQRRDFQRDILPGLTSLARHEVTEDLQTFGGLMRATGHPWHSGPNRRNATRNGCARGRRRTVAAAAAAPAPVNAVCGLPPTKQQQQQQQSNNTEAVVEDRSLTGWGKTTRRPRRQRCPAGNNAPPVPLT